MTRGRPALRPGWAARILPHIPTRPAAAIHAIELQRLTGLSYMQVIQGIQYLRQNHPQYPLLSAPRDGYFFSVDPRDVRKFAVWRVSTSHTIMNVAYLGGVLPYLSQLTADPRQVAQVRRNFERALEDLHELVAATP